MNLPLSTPRAVTTVKMTAACTLLMSLLGCAVGPDFQAPHVEAPDTWTAWHGGDASLQLPDGSQRAVVSTAWWQALNDPVLDELEQRAMSASPDLRTAALHLAQARVQAHVVAASKGPDVGFSASANRLRQSEYGASTRMADAMGGSRDQLVKVLSEPYSLYQSGFDASWELDLWGRVGRELEAAHADVDRQQSLLEQSRLTLTSEVARHYAELVSTRQQTQLVRADLAALSERQDLLAARVRAGTQDAFDMDRQQTEVLALKAQLPPLLAQEAASANQLALLLGVHPGELNSVLARADLAAGRHLPDLALGVPSELAARRPDIRQAEASLRRAVAQIGVARADLYPNVRLGAQFGLESYLSGSFAEWGSRTWSIGPSLNLPLFDGGRRQRTVQLRELEQQEAAVAFHRTVLQAWQEIDDALNNYVAEQQQGQTLQQRADSAADAYALAKARYDGGTIDFLSVLDTQRTSIQARRDVVSSAGRLMVRYVMVNKALGFAGPMPPEVQAAD